MSTSTINLPESKKEVSLPSTLESIDKAEKFINDVLEYEGVDEMHLGNILISVVEGANNAINHGNALNPDKTFTLSYGVNAKDLFFTIADQGKGFDYDSIPDPTLPENVGKVSGRGVFIIKNLADKVYFENNGSTIILQFCNVITAH